MDAVRRAEETAAWCETWSLVAALTGILALGLAPAGLNLVLGLALLAVAAILDLARLIISPEGAEALAYWRRGIR